MKREGARFLSRQERMRSLRPLTRNLFKESSLQLPAYPRPKPCPGSNSSPWNRRAQFPTLAQRRLHQLRHCPLQFSVLSPCLVSRHFTLLLVILTVLLNHHLNLQCISWLYIWNFSPGYLSLPSYWKWECPRVIFLNGENGAEILCWFTATIRIKSRFLKMT